MTKNSPYHPMSPLRSAIHGSLIRLALTEADTTALLYLGVWQASLPGLLLDDPVLEPPEKILWQVLKGQLPPGGAAIFPDRHLLCRKATLGSLDALDRSLAILRCSRWLTHGSVAQGQVYLLHDEPLELADTLMLDPGYMGFLQQEATARSASRVRAIATAALATIDADVRQGIDITQRRDPLERRLEALQTLQDLTVPGRFFSFNGSALSTLFQAQASEDTWILPEVTRREETAASADITALRFPDYLTENQRLLAGQYLNTLPPSSRQAVLDELEGRVRAVQLGAPPIGDPLRYLKHLCDTVQAGEFHPVLGQMIRDARERQEWRQAQLPQATLAS